MRNAFKLIFVLIIASVSFGLGGLWRGRNLATYTVHSTSTTFNLDKPIQGLPLVEYVMFLRFLKTGQTDRGVSSIETCIDFALEHGMRRRTFLSDEQLQDFDKVMALVAEYRRNFPRNLSNTTNASGLPFYWTVEKQAEVDEFLKTYSPTNRSLEML